MTSRRRTLLTIGVAIAGAMAIIYAISLAIVMDGFSTLQERTAFENLRRVNDAYVEMIEGLDYITADWAGWDDTYAFIKNRNQAYVADNVVDGTIAGLRLNAIVYLRPDGGIVYATGFDLDDNSRMPVPPALLAHLRAGSPLVAHAADDSRVAGLVMLPEAPMLIASRPILTSDRKGPIRGTLIFARYFDEKEVARIAKVTHFTVTAYEYHSRALPGDVEAFRRRC